MTGSGARRPPKPLAFTAKILTVVRIFLSGAYGKANKRDSNRLTETEHQRLLDRCDRTDLAEWLRQLGLGEHTSRKRRVPDVAPELLRQVSGIGNNLNQIARRLNQTDSRRLLNVPRCSSY